MSSDTLLSMMCGFGVNPQFLKFIMKFRYTIFYAGYSYVVDWCGEDDVCVIIEGHQYVVVTNV